MKTLTKKKKTAIILISIIAAAGVVCPIEPVADKNGGFWDISAIIGQGMDLADVFPTDRFLPLLLAVLAAGLMFAAAKLHFAVRDRVCAGIFAFGFSAMQLLGKSYHDSDSWGEVLGSGFTLLRSIWICLAMSVFVYHLILLAFHALDRLSAAETHDGAACFTKYTLRAPRNSCPCGAEKQLRCFTKYYLVAALLVFLCWLPYFILFFPGTSNNDTATQIAQFFGQKTWTRNMSAVRGKEIYLSNHFPFFTTVLYGVFIRLGILLGDSMYGVALYALLQMIFMAFVMTGVWFYLYRIGLSKRCLKVGLLTTAFFPLFPLDAVCMLKDVSFALFCLVMSVLLLELVRTKGASLKKKGYCALLAVSTLLLALFRSQGIYIMAVVAVLVLIVYRRYWLQVLLSFFVPILIFQMVWIRVLLPAWNVAPAGRQEALGFLFQQTARYVSTYPDDVTEEEKEAIDGVLNYEKLAEKYDPRLTDPVKYTFRQDCGSEELLAYLRAWLGMFWRHPDAYIEATLNNCYGFFYLPKPTGAAYLSYVNKSGWKPEDELYVHTPAYTETVVTCSLYVRRALQMLPAVSLLFSVGAYAWVVIYFALNTIRKKRYLYFLPGMVAILSAGILLISPANGNFRYTMPLLFVTPLLLGMCILQGREEAELK